MSNTEIRVVTGPANYFSHTGSLSRLHDFFTPDQLSHAVWVYGERAIAAARPYLPEAFHLAEAKHLLFKGHCSETDVAQLAKESGDDRSIVIGVGGGTLLDTAKALARRLDLPFVAIPTIAATCAAWTPLSVWYNDAGQALHFEIFDDANFWCWLSHESYLTHLKSIYWPVLAIRWRNGMRQWCWLRSQKRYL